MRPRRLITLGVVAFVVGSTCYYTDFPDLKPEDLRNTAGVFAQIGSTMLGFMLAALAVVASISGSKLVQVMVKTGHYHDMLQEMFLSSVLFLVCTLMSCTLLLTSFGGETFLAALVGLHVAALSSLLRVGKMLWLVLMNLEPGSP